MTTDSELIALAGKLGAAQKRGILNLEVESFKPSSEHQAMKRLWYRVDVPSLVAHAHCANDQWRLTPLGLALRDHLRARAAAQVSA